MSASIDVLDDILQRCRELGFALAGVCRAEPSGYGAELWRWLEAGKHGEMHYLASQAALRIDPSKLLPGARAIICVADRYHDGRRDRQDSRAPLEGQCGTEGGNPAMPIGRVARYARGDDYHTAIRKRLKGLAGELQGMFPQDQFRVCVDTAPILEREHAMRAGLGAIGKHTLLIAPGRGSYLLLGEIVTTLALSTSEKQRAQDATEKTVAVGLLKKSLCETSTLTGAVRNADRERDSGTVSGFFNSPPVPTLTLGGSGPSEEIEMVAAWFNENMSSTELAMFLVGLIEAIDEHEGQSIADDMTALLVALGG